jgi:hypothetical protein
MSPTIAGAAQTIKSLLDHPDTVVVDSSGAAISAAQIADLKASATAAQASAVTGVQAAG